MIIARAANATGRIWALPRGLVGVRPPNFSSLGSDDSPLDNDTDTGDATSQFLWFLTPPLVDSTSGGTTTTDDFGGYLHTGASDGSYSQGYGWSAVAADGTITEDTASIDFTIGAGAATVTGAGGIASAEAFGTATLTPAFVETVTGAGGIASGEAFGTATVTPITLATVSGAGDIASGEAFGTPTLTPAFVETVTGAGGIASGEAFGAAVVSYNGIASVIDAGDIASGEAFGNPTITATGPTPVTGAGGIASGEAFGTPVAMASFPGGASADAIFNYVLENGLTFAEMVRIMAAPLSGTATGIGTLTERYYSRDGTKARVTATFDENSNRLSVAVDGTP